MKSEPELLEHVVQGRSWYGEHPVLARTLMPLQHEDQQPHCILSPMREIVIDYDFYGAQKSPPVPRPRRLRAQLVQQQARGGEGTLPLR